MWSLIVIVAIVVFLLSSIRLEVEYIPPNPEQKSEWISIEFKRTTNKSSVDLLQKRFIENI